ncbi:Hypothetical protein, DUF2779 family [Metamycoplasma alkalescens 14918]|uniref:DUF2779 domain-containing protein n=1 Tax=Metamycoplasma alkalescens 14918 TaxID=1188234 RepID=N9SRV4_9BACT|nr:DUF2779 domain-containing protein [Metamycoplasma alkalescens]ENY54180.1 Hypothetical protein, DUF2779 family [Metamycoplasma alkalescens 14918]
MKKKNKFSFNDFLIANTTRPWFIFNNIDEIDKNNKKILLNAENLFEFDEENVEEELDFLDFKIIEIEEIFEKHIIKNLDTETKKQLNKYPTYEKIDFLKKQLDNNQKLKKIIDDDEILKNINYLFSIFANLNMVAIGLDEVSNQAIAYLIDFYKKKYQISDQKIKFISLKNTLENRILETKKAIEEGYTLLINPIFEYQNCYSKVLFCDLKQNYFGNLNYSNKTKKKNILKAYFDYHIIKNYFDIKEIFILKPKFQKAKNIKKNKLDFLLSKYSSISKAGISIDKEKKNALSEDEINALYISDPNFEYSSKRKTKNSPKNNISILEHIKANMIFANYDFDAKKIADDHEKINSIYTCSFKEFLYLINNYNNLDVDWKITKDDFIDNFGANIWFLKIFNKAFPNYEFGSKNILKVISGVENKINSLQKKQIKEFYDNNLIAIDPNIENLFEYKVIANKEINIAWFDFEGVSLPYPMMDNVAHWNQIISQTSIIKTKNNQIYQSNDFVYDPLNYDLNTYKKIVDDLYDKEISYYIIYNEGYEKTKLNEIKEKMWFYINKKQLSSNEYQEYCQKIDFIVNRLVDICKFFSPHGSQYFVRNRTINLGQIHGSYSIKKIEYFVTKNNLAKYLKHKIIPYSELNVKNGSLALLIATTRALGVIGDEEWKQKTSDLKKYCHNDVLAMLMTANLIEYLMNKKDEYFYNWKKYNC